MSELVPYLNPNNTGALTTDGLGALVNPSLFEDLCCRTQCLITFEAKASCISTEWLNKRWEYVSHIKYKVPICDEYIEAPGTFRLVSGKIVCDEFFEIGSIIEVWGPVLTAGKNTVNPYIFEIELTEIEQPIPL